MKNIHMDFILWQKINERHYHVLAKQELTKDSQLSFRCAQAMENGEFNKGSLHKLFIHTCS
ncbi:hypothetical protein ACJIZ3_023726 [Penstemon smallii]|uniref:Uncharacterized protein n=1 Tax=Penstemon smallii TaxID=265156 RepID=A0ABD3TQ16_9LAMI